LASFYFGAGIKSTSNRVDQLGRVRERDVSERQCCNNNQFAVRSRMLVLHKMESSNHKMALQPQEPSNRTMAFQPLELSIHTMA
jgi:hypothetical protein